MSELHWRAFCDSCQWHVEFRPDRLSARDAGQAHIKAEHPDGEEWAFRVQGLRPTTSWAVYEDNPSEEESNTDRARKILEMVHQLDAMPWDAVRHIEDDVFIYLASCQTAIEAVFGALENTRRPG